MSKTNPIIAAHLAGLAALGACGAGPGRAGVDSRPAVGDAAAIADAEHAADAPSSPSSVDPATDGRFAVTTRSITIPVGSRSATATTFVPNTAPAPRPLVFVSPGFQMPRTQYTSYAHHLATWGFTVVLADYTDTSFGADHQKLADDIRAEITWALAQPDLAIDPLKIATAGHSLGGDLAMLVAADDARVGAVLGWDPVDGSPSVTPEKMANVHAAVAVIGETTDGAGGGMPCAPTADNYAAFYAAAPSPALEMTVAHADHMDWVDDPSCAFCSFCAGGTADPALARTATRRLDVAWLRRQFDGDTAMDGWLVAPPEVAAGTASVTTK